MKRKLIQMCQSVDRNPSFPRRPLVHNLVEKSGEGPLWSSAGLCKVRSSFRTWCHGRKTAKTKNVYAMNKSQPELFIKWWLTFQLFDWSSGIRNQLHDSLYLGDFFDNYKRTRWSLSNMYNTPSATEACYSDLPLSLFVTLLIVFDQFRRR